MPKESQDNQQPGFKQALRLFKEAAQRIPAYKDFLAKAKIDPEKINTEADFSSVPPTDKPTYISAYKIEDLSWDGKLAQTKYISSSSGSTGKPFYWPRGNTQNETVDRIFQKIYESIFDTLHGRTLFLDLFALGTWIAGLEFYNAAKYTADRGSMLAIATPGIEKAVAIDAIKNLSNSFDRLILAGYPPFLKDLLESGSQEGVDWKKHDIRLITGGEAFSERWRHRILQTIGQENSLTHSVNIYGMAETGVVGHETPLTIYIRKNTEKVSALKDLLLHEGEIAPLYQYDPTARYLEIGADNSILMTTNAGLPLIRYNTRDQGGLFNYAEVQDILEIQNDALKTWKDSPFVYLFGRRDLSISFYALNIYVENLKTALETWQEPALLSGLFTMRVGHTRTLDQRFEIVIELDRAAKSSITLGRKLTNHIVKTLCKVNSEYAKLYSAIGRRAVPKVSIVRYGELETMPGRKHKWIKVV